MTEVWFAGLLLLASVAVTYACCVRPMRRGSRCYSPGPDVDAAEIRRLRREVAALRGEAGTR